MHDEHHENDAVNYLTNAMKRHQEDPFPDDEELRPVVLTRGEVVRMPGLPGEVSVYGVMIRVSEWRCGKLVREDSRPLLVPGTEKLAAFLGLAAAERAAAEQNSHNL